MTGPASPEFPDLLTAAAAVLEQAGEIGPVTVTCDRAIRLLPPVTIAPATLALPADVQRGIVHAIAEAMGWHVRPVDDGNGAAAAGPMAVTKVEAIAVPMRSGDRPGRRRTTTAAHAKLLRGLVDWAAALPVQARSLTIAERTEGEAGEGSALGVWLTVRDHADVEAVRSEVIVPITSDGWSGLRGLGVLPTGHDLTITVARP